MKTVEESLFRLYDALWPLRADGPYEGPSDPAIIKDADALRSIGVTPQLAQILCDRGDDITISLLLLHTKPRNADTAALVR